MSVDYYSCKRCGRTFNDCGYFVGCDNCGEHWCSDKCAEQDGYIYKLDKDDYLIEDSCKYCRREDFEDSQLLLKAMELLNCDREYLIDRCKGE